MSAELPRGWELATVADVADVQLGRQRSPQHHTGPNMRPYLRAANVTWAGLDLADVKEMNFDPAEAVTFELREGDILLNEASGSPNEVGKPAIWRGEIPGCCFQNTLLRVRSRGPVMQYLYWYFFYMALLGRFGEAGRGVNIRHLGKAGLTRFPLPIAPIEEQRRIVAAIEEQFSRLDGAEAQLRRVARRLGYELTARGGGSLVRRAILQAAFAGELVPQDESDEPARYLLECIKVEREAKGTPRRSRRVRQ